MRKKAELRNWVETLQKVVPEKLAIFLHRILQSLLGRVKLVLDLRLQWRFVHHGRNW